MNQFYMQPTNGVYCDIKLKAENWEEAIKEVKDTASYHTIKTQSAKSRIKKGLSDNIEVYCNKLRKELTFADLRNQAVYRRVY